MARKTDIQRIQQIARYIEEHPGSKSIDVARGLKVPPSTVTRYLPALEEQGILLSEDKHGRLWPFDKRR
ncbi:MAG: winged helix-turn-helix transcriptional regulator [Anaerolineae bacterium]